MKLPLKQSWAVSATVQGSSRMWRLLIDAGILLGLMLTGTWLVYR
jgi:hypothetical protein